MGCLVRVRRTIASFPQGSFLGKAVVDLRVVLHLLKSASGTLRHLSQCRESRQAPLDRGCQSYRLRGASAALPKADNDGLSAEGQMQYCFMGAGHSGERQIQRQHDDRSRAAPEQVSLRKSFGFSCSASVASPLWITASPSPARRSLG